MPVFFVGISFGLAVDYEVFLVFRIYEAHEHVRITAMRWSAGSGTAPASWPPPH
jgi:uncharacterized membrane protein YdfJ with MMPL/SSD domain